MVCYPGQVPDSQYVAPPGVGFGATDYSRPKQLITWMAAHSTLLAQPILKIDWLFRVRKTVLLHINTGVAV